MLIDILRDPIWNGIDVLVAILALLLAVRIDQGKIKAVLNEVSLRRIGIYSFLIALRGRYKPTPLVIFLLGVFATGILLAGTGIIFRMFYPLQESTPPNNITSEVSGTVSFTPTNAPTLTNTPSGALTPANADYESTPIPTMTHTQTPTLTSSPLPEPTRNPIPVDQWCIFVVPEGEKMTIRDIIVNFLREGEIAETYKNDVLEATNGDEWQKIWSEDVWDIQPLPEDIVDGKIVTARVALNFVKFIDDCVTNGGTLRKRP